MSNAAQPVWDHAHFDPGRVALRDARGAWSYRALRDRARLVGGALLRAGVIAGDRVLFIAPSVPEFVAVYYGIHAAGAIAVTANTMSTTPELEYIGGDAGVKLVIGWTGVEVAPRAAAAKLGVPYWPLRAGLAGLGTPLPLIDPHPTDDNDTAAILYTSGTTGRPKGAELTHGNLIAGASIFVGVHGLTPDDRLGTALPLFHAYGQVCVMATALCAGSSLSLLAQFDAESMVAMLRRDELTFLAGVPTMWNGMLTPVGIRARLTSPVCASQHRVAQRYPLKSAAPSRIASAAGFSRGTASQNQLPRRSSTAPTGRASQDRSASRYPGARFRSAMNVAPSSRPVRLANFTFAVRSL